mmetsp:Transcript_62126/g.201462  ORF Transcript_62126/g.201462 Transcript_62126/m.201462 type:complete len:562 (+) Transcript_62126:226-1911(+)
MEVATRPAVALPSAVSFCQEWVPNYLQGVLEQRLGERGTNLRELAGLAASLEDLIDKEAIGRLETAYELHNLPRDRPITPDQAEEVLRTYYVNFLLAGNFSADSRWEAVQKTKRFASRYTGWDAADNWLHALLKPRITGKTAFDFAETSRMVEDIGEEYYKFNDMECLELKSTLRGMEGKKPGRVRLAHFYSKALYSHWRFTEKADYLRVLGALDESDPQSPHVIVSNYIMARPNCLEASHLYAICCRNECEDMMGHLETNIGSATAPPKRIAELVAALSSPSDSVGAPRTLSDALLSRLDQVAASNGGVVPLHGRLFAQWMHHAYPRECPYPHEVGSTSPQTPDEWMSQTGQDDSQASQDEMRKAVAADSCGISWGPGSASQAKDCGGDSELPWNANEELLQVGHAPQSAPAAATAVPTALAAQAAPERRAAAAVVEEAAAVEIAATRGLHRAVDAAVVVGLVAFLAFEFRRASPHCGPGGLKFKDESVESFCRGNASVNWQAIAVFSIVSCVAYVLGLLDSLVFGCALCGSVGSLAIRYFMQENIMVLPTFDACSKSAV